MSFTFSFFRLPEDCDLYSEYCSALAFGQDVHFNAVSTAMTDCIRGISHTLVVSYVCSREGVLRSNPTTPYFGKCFPSFFGTFRECPSIGISYTMLYPVILAPREQLKCSYELMRVSFAGMRYFLTDCHGFLESFSFVQLARSTSTPDASKKKSPTTSFMEYSFQTNIPLFLRKYRRLTLCHLHCSFEALSTFVEHTRILTIVPHEVHTWQRMGCIYLTSWRYIPKQKVGSTCLFP